MIHLTWADLKGIIDSGATFRYFDINNYYIIFIVDSAIIFRTDIYKDSGSDQTDFENNYQSNASSFSQGNISFSSNASVTQVSSSASSVMLLSANSKRKGGTFVNDSTQICYIKFGTMASTGSYTIKMEPGSILMLDVNPIYTGRIDAIWEAANGIMAITELT